MKKKEKRIFFRSIYRSFFQLQTIFREEIQRELLISEATFYRKIKDDCLSNAQKEKVISIALTMAMELDNRLPREYPK